MDWSPQQQRALDAVGRWLKNPRERIFRLFGYAGTGKTTLAQHLAAGVEGTVFFAAFTGKAALCMRRAGCPGAQTIHSLIYRPQTKGRERVTALERKIQDAPASLVTTLQRELREEKANLRRPSFSLNLDSPLKGASLLVVDECSMVDERMAEDMMWFDVPILALGDPAQLPPVFGAGYFTEAEPDIMLEEIHRQARDNPIVDLASRVRRGQSLQYGEYGESRVVSVADFDRDVDPDDAQLLVGLNRTRIRANDYIRRGYLMSYTEPVEDGEKLVCLKNERESGLLNGSLWRAAADAEHDGKTISVTVCDEDDASRALHVEILSDCFHDRDALAELDPHVRREYSEFDYGYALTVHKAQGSQFSGVVVLDESHRLRNISRRRWLYTAITRAVDRVTVVI